MEIRMLDEHWRPAVMSLWDYCFEKKGDPFFEWYFERYCRLTQVIGATADERLLAMAHLNPYQLILRGKVTPAAYFVGVATTPEVRGRGVFRPLLQGALSYLRAQGHGVALLMPSAASFYRPYGFAFCYHQWKINCPLAQLAPLTKGAAEVSWRRGETEDWAAFASVYDRAMRSRNGFTHREEKAWRSLLTALYVEGGHAFIAVNQAGAPVAYLWFEISGETLQVIEWLADDLSLQRACLAFLQQHRSQAEQVVFMLPEDDLLYEQLPDSSYLLSLSPFMMGRIVDVEQALQQCLPACCDEQNIDFTLSVHDSVAEWNNGCWRIAANGGSWRVERVRDKAADVVFSVAALAQLCFGRFTTSQLAVKGEVSGRQDVLALLDRLLPVCHNYINEYY